MEWEMCVEQNKRVKVDSILEENENKIGEVRQNVIKIDDLSM
ncbi:hypothetical protein [Campylobacter sp. CCUG 57310]|nr:hypothetical protein [Campylobacter sp. CCUG 57310]